MKSVKRINESQLKTIVAESIKKVLNERKTYGNEIEKALQDIYHAAVLICNKTASTTGTEYEPDIELGYDDDAYLHQWAKKVCDEADTWLN